MQQSKIAIIGAGAVGATTAYVATLKNLAAEILLIDVNETKEEAIASLQSTFLNIGAEIYEDCKTKADSASARVYRQSPTGRSVTNMGSSVDVWLTNDASKINYNPPTESDSLNLHD